MHTNQPPHPKKNISSLLRRGSIKGESSDVCVYAHVARAGGRDQEEHAPAFEGRQLAQLDSPKPMVPKCAQQRILSKARPKRLRIKRANAPSQTRTATASRARIPRDKQRAEPPIKNHDK